MPGYGLPSRGQRDWDTPLNDSLGAINADVQSAKADASNAVSTANAARNRADEVHTAVLSGADGATAGFINDNASQTAQALSATIGAEAGTLSQRAEFPLAKYASLQAAIDAANAAGGGVVRLPAGATPVSATIQMKSKVILAGPDAEFTVWGYNTSPETYHTAWLAADGTAGPVVEFGINVVSAGVRNLLIKAGGRVAVNMPDSTTRGGNRLRNVYAHGGGIYLGQREVRVADLIIMQAPGDGLTVAAQDSDLDRAVIGYCGGDGMVLTANSGPIRMTTLDTFFNAGDGLQLNGDGHKIGRVQSNDNGQRGVAFLATTNSVILDLTAANNSRETATIPANHHPDVAFVHPTASNLGCAVVGGKIINDGKGSYAVYTNEVVPSFPLIMGVTFGGSYVNGTSPYAYANAPTTLRLRGCLNVPDVTGPQGGIPAMYRPNGPADMVQATDGANEVHWGITAGGQVYDKTLDLCLTADPRMPATAGAWPGANRCIFSRVTVGGILVSKIGFEVTTSSGNISAAVYRNTGTGRSAAPGTRVATTGTVACPAVGYAEVTLDTPVTVYPGDWIALTCDNTTAGFARFPNPTGAATILGLLRRQDTAHPAPSTVGTLAASSYMPVLVGVA